MPSTKIQFMPRPEHFISHVTKRTEAHRMVGTTVILAPQPFLIFCTTLCLCIQQPCTLNKVHYLADRDVSKVIGFKE